MFKGTVGITDAAKGIGQADGKRWASDVSDTGVRGATFMRKPLYQPILSVGATADASQDLRSREIPVDQRGETGRL
jgi:hypothetical protein